MLDTLSALVIAERELMVQATMLFLIFLAFLGVSLVMLMVLWRMIRDLLR